MPEKRRKFSRGHRDAEKCSIAVDYLRKFESQRLLASNKARIRKTLRKVGSIKLSELAKHSKIATVAKEHKERK